MSEYQKHGHFWPIYDFLFVNYGFILPMIEMFSQNIRNMEIFFVNVRNDLSEYQKHGNIFGQLWKCFLGISETWTFLANAKKCSVRVSETWNDRNVLSEYQKHGHFWPMIEMFCHQNIRFIHGNGQL